MFWLPRREWLGGKSGVGANVDARRPRNGYCGGLVKTAVWTSCVCSGDGEQIEHEIFLQRIKFKGRSLYSHIWLYFHSCKVGKSQLPRSVAVKIKGHNTEKQQGPTARKLWCQEEPQTMWPLQLLSVWAAVRIKWEVLMKCREPHLA